MRSPLLRAALVLAGAAAFPLLAASPASAEQAQYCVWVPNVTVGLGPRPMTTTYTELCVPWP